jgi:uncharacterized iron-regulated protein
MNPKVLSAATVHRRLLAICLSFFFIGACNMKPELLKKVDGLDQTLAEGTIYDTAQGKAIDFEELLVQLAPARVVYVGEQHIAADHHRIQLKIIQGLVGRGQRVSVGMEMFDHTYQKRLDQWSAGHMDWETFLKRTHWYANWKFDDNLYKEILLYIKAEQLKLVGLNIPFHLPRKISVGGLDNLLASERKLLPRQIDTTQNEHRAYVEAVFHHHTVKKGREFENFYAAQCAWEDGMARSVAENLGDGTMVVIAGNGHIVRKFGIPNRAFKRSQAPFRTVYLATPGMDISVEDGDFIWMTSSETVTPHGH